MAQISHADIVPRLKRAEGHLRSVIAMVEAGKPCLDVAQQLHAVEAAVANAKKMLIHDHIEHCLQDGRGPDVKAVLGEIKQLTKYL
ncbi:metal-sensing transcriptional repressor [Blastochloris sulfoviridis]|uniref:Metal-sensing transcriptional repressor n=1 Tax=Blastochloris sulfoviridis TaxID=50712 RepID=A0A5M6HUC3_9HYPH|nr:metal-sensing transcriptional repressor [Blastochloris sulfoviridis]KAA5599490.1 metal-sensing transcriptional repressor [Blastochloris sulfoviridis]